MNRELETPRPFAGLIKAFGKQGDFETALCVYQDLLANNLKPTVYVFANLITAASNAKKLEKLSEIFQMMKKNPPIELESHPISSKMSIVWTAVQSALINNHRPEEVC